MASSNSTIDKVKDKVNKTIRDSINKIDLDSTAGPLLDGITKGDLKKVSGMTFNMTSIKNKLEGFNLIEISNFLMAAAGAAKSANQNSLAAKFNESAKDFATLSQVDTMIRQTLNGKAIRRPLRGHNDTPFG
jgi:hypothetical protein